MYFTFVSNKISIVNWPALEVHPNINAWNCVPLALSCAAEQLIWADTWMPVLLAELYESATTVAETVIVQNVRGHNVKNGY